MKLSNLDKVILLLPVMGVFDVLSTFFAAWQGYSLYIYEVGLFASYFAQRGLLILYVFVYLGILSGMAALLFFIKRDVSTSESHDELVLLLLVTTIYLLEAVLANVIVSNFLVASGSLAPIGGLRWLIYLSVFVTILAYTWDELKELLGFSAYGGE